MDNLRIPPHSIDAEAAFLSAVLERNSLIDDCDQILKESDFYIGCHKAIFRRMLAMAFAGQPIDPVTLLTALEAYRDWETDRKSTRLNSSHLKLPRMPSSA